MKMGDVATIKRRITQADFDRFARLSGDDNPIHVDPIFCETTRFGRTLCHGMFLYGLISEEVRKRFARGSLQLEQDLKFPGPAFAGDELWIRLAVTQVDAEQGVAELETVISSRQGTVCCEGRCLVRFREEG